MADYMIEIEFQLGDYTRDLDLLDSIGTHLEADAGETGPSAAIHGDRYSVTLVIDAPTAREASVLAAAVTVDAINKALAERDDKLDVGVFERLVERMLVEHAEQPAELALA